jgi:pyruvate dehydrogenase phosphatase regulatory subunit
VFKGGVWNPLDSTVSPVELCRAFASEARKQGIKIFEDCEVSRVLVKETRGGQYCKVRGVETNLGTVECDIFVNCGGIVIFLKKLF